MSKELTAEMLREVFRQTQREILEIGVPERYQARWDRMADLLNAKLATQVEPQIYAAVAKLSELSNFTVIVFIGDSLQTEMEVMERASDAIYDSGLDDDIKDQLRRTLAYMPVASLAEMRNTE